MKKQRSLSRIVALEVLLLGAFAICPALTFAGESPAKTPGDAAPPSASKHGASEVNAPPPAAVKALEEKVSEQQAQIEKLTRAVELLSRRLNETSQASAVETPHPVSVGQVSSLTPVIPASTPTASPASSASLAVPAAGAPATAAQVEEYTKKVDTLGKTVETLNKGIAGFKFSGDLRFRYDGIFRSANSDAGPAQNSRERYRVRLNVNKEVADQFGFHVQLGTGTANNPATYDSDFSGANTRNYLWLTEYWGDYHPHKNFSLRAGRMSEVFADDSKFLWDDDVRLNGLQEIAKVPISDNASVEFRAGQYIFTNPNKQILPSAAACAGTDPPADCVFLQAGFSPGGKVRDATLFHQGAVFNAKSGDKWNHRFYVDYQHYINPTEFLIASSFTSGVPVLVNGVSGLTLAGGVGQLGNGTTTKGGFMYTAPDYHVGHVGYRVDYAGWKTSRQSWPVWLDVQAARNFGGSFLNNAWMGTISIGSVKKAGDLRILYGYFVKEADSMISQVTDDDIGTGISTNVRSHYIRVDLGLTKYLQWQNLLYVQNQISSSDPTRNFFVAGSPPGANTQYRIHSQFAISF